MYGELSDAVPLVVPSDRGRGYGIADAQTVNGLRSGMLNLQSGDRIELLYEDAPAATIRATVNRLLTDRDEGMGIEIEDYAACWIEITVDEPSDMDAKQVVCLGRTSTII
jgi:hypothetical protein